MSGPKSRVPTSVEASVGGKGSAQQPSGRRSHRVAIDMPVEVVGKTLNGKEFRQETRTTAVNAHGALVVLAITTDVEPSLLLTNKRTGEKAECRLVHQKRIESGKSELGIEFVTPQPRFWGIAFPPDDWNRAERKIPGFTSK
jgi:hypothetical protein